MRGLRLLLAVLLVPTWAAAQHPTLGAPAPRPLHVQLADADAAAIARVGEVGLGRIHLVDSHAVLGAPATDFQLKRAPSAAPPLAVGDRALLLLRGARSPYLLASEPTELILLADPAEEPAWARGLRALHEAGTDGAAIARVYASWLDGPSRMQREAAIGLAREDCPASALVPELVRGLVERALESDDAALRRAAASAAIRRADGRSLLLERLPSRDPQVLVTALAAASGAGEAAGMRETLLRALRHEDVEVRRTAVRFVVGFENDREVRARLVRIASEDSDAQLRELARGVMRRGVGER